jgi:hypothetical protein
VHFGGRRAYKQRELFKVGDVTGRIRGHDALHVADAVAVYLGCYQEASRKFCIYHLQSRRAEPPHEFDLDENERVVPRARPCNLDQYLVCYVDRKHRLSGPCINHVKHYLTSSLYQCLSV